ncbi:MAG: NADP-dependent malic enzyme [Candidatus Hodarchaeota archaeon]
MTGKQDQPSAPKSLSSTVDELLRKADEPNRLSEKLHPFYQGKVEVIPKCSIWDFDAFGVWYTPGVARACRMIEAGLKQHDVQPLYTLTNKWNNVAVVSDGSRVLGLGNIGPEAGMPVMEGKALLFKYLGGVDAFPVCLECHETEEIIQTVKNIQPCFGGINLEDIAQPKCFDILDRLRNDKDMRIPVWHDDAQGTASIEVAGVINALKIVGKKMSEVTVAMLGAGAANISIARVLVGAGLPIRNLMIVDSKGILHPDREDKENLEKNYKQKWHFALNSNCEGRTGGIEVAVKDADVLLCASKSRNRNEPPVVPLDALKTMADDAIAFFAANPVPEVWPWEAKECGIKVIATGRSDFPNQINNSLGFPGIFRGTLDVHAYTITDEMVIAVAREIAQTAEDNEDQFGPDYIVPTMDDWTVFPREATACALQAIKEGTARIKPSRDEIYAKAEAIIRRARELTQSLMKNNFIKPADLS